GAKRWDIRLQFLTEALVLSLIGGLIGVAVGLIGVGLVSVLSSFDAVVSVFYIILPFSFAGVVGLFFGFYPAYKASMLNPINALRYE
ncbi:MAG: FtsX-like permease family protein, partial [Alphaproteobacteria bacterium]|nr:FtsX-like permease family protein [Alphaproteobacteria bacterium]